MSRPITLLAAGFLILIAALLTAALAYGDTTTAVYYAPDTRLVPAVTDWLDASTGTVTVAAPVLSSSAITAALVRAETRGVTVRAVLDVSRGTSAVRGGYALASAGATVLACTFNQTIGNNFMTTAGSLTTSGNYVWSNSAVQTGQYCQFISGTGAASLSASTYSTLAASGTPFLSYSGSFAGQPTSPPRVWFSPNGQCEAEIVSEIDHACSSIFVTAYDFTSRPIADALQRAQTRGVKVAIVQDLSASIELGSVSPLNVARHLDVYLDSHERIMHSKYIILDSQKVLTGSYNWTNNAEHSNAENLVLLDDPATAATFTDDWNKHAAHSRRVTIPPATHTERPPPSTQCPNGRCSRQPTRFGVLRNRWKRF